MKRLALLILLVVLFTPDSFRAQGRRTPDEKRVYQQELIDSLAAKADTMKIDSLKYRYGQAGQIISPGYAYYQDTTDGKWYLADSSITVKADGLAKDSLAIDEVGRFQVSGYLTIPWYNYPTPGVDLVSGFTPGAMVVTDASRDSTLKMHRLAESTNDSTTVIVGIAKNFWIWVAP